MAKGIYKQKGSEFYWIRYAGADGKVVRESSKTSNFKEAQAKLENQRKSIREGKEPEPIKRIPILHFFNLQENIPNGVRSKRDSRVKKVLLTSLPRNLEMFNCDISIQKCLNSSRVKDCCRGTDR